jgi:hypothetical protein
LATFVDGDGLEMTEGVVNEIDCRALHRQRLCSFVGQNDGDGPEARFSKVAIVFRAFMIDLLIIACLYFRSS